MAAPLLIVGSGAMACLFAARLSAAGAGVRVLADWPAGLQALRERGACLEELDGTRCYPVEVVDDLAACRGAHTALVLVKSWQTGQAARQLSAVLAEDGVALTLQNGLGARETLSAALGAERVAAGVTTLGATLLAPGLARPTPTGEVNLQAHPRLGELEALLRHAGILVSIESDLDRLLWGKLVVNAAINPLTALLRVKNGALLRLPQARLLYTALAREGEAVARAAGVALPYPDAPAEVERVLRQTADNRSSMLQDILRGAPTEIEAINGALLRHAARLGVPAPANAAVTRLVKTAVQAAG